MTSYITPMVLVTLKTLVTLVTVKNQLRCFIINIPVDDLGSSALHPV